MSLWAGFRMEISLTVQGDFKDLSRRAQENQQVPRDPQQTPALHKWENFQIQHGREQPEALNSPPTKRTSWRYKANNCSHNPLWQGRFDFLSYIMLYITFAPSNAIFLKFKWHLVLKTHTTFVIKMSSATSLSASIGVICNSIFPPAHHEDHILRSKNEKIKHTKNNCLLMPLYTFAP